MENFLRCSDVQRLTALSRTEIYRQIRRGTFPAPIPSGGKAVRWLQSAIENWQQERIERPWTPRQSPKR